MKQPSNPVRLLLVDDDEDDYLIFRSLIADIPGNPFKLEWIDDFDNALDIIRRSEHDVYVIDYRLGKHDGMELLQEFDLVERPQPFIVLTGAGDEQVERTAMKLGAADYLVKGTFNTELLSRVLNYSLQRKRIEAQRVQQLIELNKSKDEFIALASHQLRTPATAVKQYVGMILEGFAGDVTAEQYKLLESAYVSNDRQIQVVNDILRVAKLDLKKITLKKRSVDIAKMTDGIIRDLMIDIKKRGQTIRFNKPDEPIEVPVDAEYIRMAISNIIDNASKYTPDGKTITVTVVSSPKAVNVAIKDEGVGIPKSAQGKLFKKFSRIDNPLSVKVGGTGLGLYWSNEIVQLHSGTIEVDSEPGKGTRFTIKLPRA